MARTRWQVPSQSPVQRELGSRRIKGAGTSAAPLVSRKVIRGRAAVERLNLELGPRFVGPLGAAVVTVATRTPRNPAINFVDPALV